MKKLRVGGIERAVVWHGIADFSCKNVLCGLKSTSHTFPCAECEFRIGTVADENTVLRTSERMKECLGDYQDNFLVGMKEEEAAKVSKGVIEESMLPFPPRYFTTPQVHLLTGPGARLLSHLEGQAISKDLNDSGYSRTLRCMEDRSKVEKELQGELRVLGDGVKHLQLAVGDGAKIVKILGGAVKGSNLSCAAPLCLHGSCFTGKQKLRRSKAWSTISCGGCHVGFHSVCVGRVSDEMFMDPIIRCPWCEKWDEAKARREVRDNIKKVDDILELTLQEISSKREKINKEIALVRGKGKWYSKLKSYMSSKGVSRALWFQSYTGREVRTILKEETLEACFKLLEIPESGTLWEAMCSFRDVVVMAKPRFLTKNEIEKLAVDVRSFVRCYRILHNTADRSVKFHYLDAHFIHYVREFETFGMATEQAVEHFHALFNQYEERFQCLGNPGSRLARIMVEHLISSPYVRREGEKYVQFVNNNFN